ncbi:DgyrCDS10882 [Dimorphilus gyrociliatus]|uniref:DgyrCDS10882 n=1 Tax=Dimorphilus gyrociliatus TaxID=2664684 RepID=A0A7I8W315_9ANNE|nr:DgyrCDS10882 [Dimorphilus gyrociliatus]
MLKAMATLGSRVLFRNQTCWKPVKNLSRFQVPKQKHHFQKSTTLTSLLQNMSISESFSQTSNFHTSVQVEMPRLVTIRHKKMKKHKLKKFRKRMHYVLKKQKEQRLKKRLKAIKAEEVVLLNEARKWNPEKVLEEEIEAAKRGGWKVDVLENYKRRQSLN